MHLRKRTYNYRPLVLKAEGSFDEDLFGCFLEDTQVAPSAWLLSDILGMKEGGSQRQGDGPLDSIPGTQSGHRPAA